MFVLLKPFSTLGNHVIPGHLFPLCSGPQTGSFFILNLCVGVIVDNWTRIKDSGEDAFLTPFQKQWIAAKCRPRRDTSPIGKELQIRPSGYAQSAHCTDGKAGERPSLALFVGLHLVLGLCCAKKRYRFTGWNDILGRVQTSLSNCPARQSLESDRLHYGMRDLHLLSIARRSVFFFVVSPPFERSILMCILSASLCSAAHKYSYTC